MGGGIHVVVDMVPKQPLLTQPFARTVPHPASSINLRLTHLTVSSSSLIMLNQSIFLAALAKNWVMGGWAGFAAALTDCSS